MYPERTCTTCANEVPNGARFCPWCATPVAPMPAAQAQTPAAGPPQRPPQQQWPAGGPMPAPARGTREFVLAGVVGTVVVILAVVAVLLITRDNGTSSDRVDARQGSTSTSSATTAPTTGAPAVNTPATAPATTPAVTSPAFAPAD